MRILLRVKKEDAYWLLTNENLNSTSWISNTGKLGQAANEQTHIIISANIQIKSWNLTFQNWSTDFRLLVQLYTYQII